MVTANLGIGSGGTSSGGGTITGGWGLTGNSSLDESNYLGTSDGSSLTLATNGTPFFAADGSQFLNVSAVGLVATYSSGYILNAPAVTVNPGLSGIIINGENGFNVPNLANNYSSYLLYYVPGNGSVYYYDTSPLSANVWNIGGNSSPTGGLGTNDASPLAVIVKGITFLSADASVNLTLSGQVVNIYQTGTDVSEGINLRTDTDTAGGSGVPISLYTVDGDLQVAVNGGGAASSRALTINNDTPGTFSLSAAGLFSVSAHDLSLYTPLGLTLTADTSVAWAVSGTYALSVTGAYTETITGGAVYNITGGITANYGGNLNETLTGSRTITMTGNDTVVAGSTSFILGTAANISTSAGPISITAISGNLGLACNGSGANVAIFSGQNNINLNAANAINLGTTNGNIQLTCANAAANILLSVTGSGAVNLNACGAAGVINVLANGASGAINIGASGASGAINVSGAVVTVKGTTDAGTAGITPCVLPDNADLRFVLIDPSTGQLYFYTGA